MVTFNKEELEQLRRAWKVLSPKVEEWLAASSPDARPPIDQPFKRLYWHNFIQPVKDVIQDAPGHFLTLEQLYAAIEQRMGSEFAARDRKVLASGTVRWKTFVNQVGVELRKSGHLDPNADRGVWQLKRPGHPQ